MKNISPEGNDLIETYPRAQTDNVTTLGTRVFAAKMLTPVGDLTKDLSRPIQRSLTLVR